jgi:Fic family protein
MTDLHAQLARVDALKTRFDAALPLPPSLLESLRLDWEVTHTFNSNAIEGSTLTLGETKAILLDGVTIGGKSLREHLEAVNHRTAMRLMNRLAARSDSLTESEILELHACILTGIQDADAGRYRDVRVRVVGSNRIFPNPAKVPELVLEFVQYINTLEVHPVIRAGRAHFGLVHIHPFVDGNGRTARLLMNLLLIRAGYPPALVPLEVRARYYDALEAANDAHFEAFDALVVELVAVSLDRVLEVVS